MCLITGRVCSFVEAVNDEQHQAGLWWCKIQFLGTPDSFLGVYTEHCCSVCRVLLRPSVQQTSTATECKASPRAQERPLETERAQRTHNSVNKKIATSLERAAPLQDPCFATTVSLFFLAHPCCLIFLFIFVILLLFQKSLLILPLLFEFKAFLDWIWYVYRALWGWYHK